MDEKKMYNFKEIFDITNKAPELIALFPDAPEIIKQRVVKSKPHTIKYIINPSEEVQLIAVSEDGSTLKHIKNPTPAACKIACANDVNAIQYIKDMECIEECMTIAVSCSALNRFDNTVDVGDLKYLTYDTLRFLFYRGVSFCFLYSNVKNKGYIKENNGVKHFEFEFPRDMLLEAAARPNFSLEDIDKEDKDEELIMVALKGNGKNIYHVENPTYEMWLTAVTSYPNIYNDKGILNIPDSYDTPDVKKASLTGRQKLLSSAMDLDNDSLIEFMIENYSEIANRDKDEILLTFLKKTLEDECAKHVWKADDYDDSKLLESLK